MKELKSKGIDARIHVAQRTSFGYILCKSNEIDQIEKLLPLDKKYGINKEPVSGAMKQIIINSMF